MCLEEQNIVGKERAEFTEEMLVCARCGDKIPLSDTIRFAFGHNEQTKQRALERFGQIRVVICTVCYAEVLWRGQTFWR